MVRLLHSVIIISAFAFSGCISGLATSPSTTVNKIEYTAHGVSKEIVFDTALHSQKHCLRYDLEKCMDELEKENKSYTFKLLCAGIDKEGEYSLIIHCTHFTPSNIQYMARYVNIDKFCRRESSIGGLDTEGLENRGKFLDDLLEIIDTMDISKGKNIENVKRRSTS